MDAILTIKYDFHCLKIIIVLCFHYSVIYFWIIHGYNQILNNLTQSFGREAAISLR
jgi:CHASE3 domain sensor protein